MKNSAFLKVLFCIFLQCNILSAQAEQNVGTSLKILPYIEAEGELDSSDGDAKLTWVSPNKVLFGTSVHSGFSDPSCSTKNPRFECPKATFDRTKIFMVFDISDKKTTFNIKNEFYDNQLELFNQHRYWDYSGCPNMSREGTIGYIPLKENDGCIKEVEVDKVKHIRKFSYVRPDGKSFDILERPFGDNLRSWVWIDWLKAYLLRTGVSLSSTSEGNGSWYVSSPSSIILLSPTSGKFNFVEVGEHEFSGATATRAGVIVYLDSNINNKIEEGKQGLTLIRNNKNYTITKGKWINQTAVSPDGCHVSYLVPRRVYEMRSGYLQDIIYSKLRVIDVCTEFNVAKDANPFAALLK
jgi:hypothetical protein